jgi:2-polyprenyl-6-methoxyphenol hydroxylase-like FAD-dependent oxidoreductase
MIVGGGMCGLASASMLADDGHEVTVIERDKAPLPPDVETAYETWDRSSVAQFNLGHWMHAAGTKILKNHVPEAYRLLLENGGCEFNITKYLLSMQPGVELTPEDDDCDLLTGRRSTLEWALANAVEQHAGATVRRGAVVAGLGTGSEIIAGVPHVTGVRLDDGSTIDADLVIDATGRRSPTLNWLADIEARAPIEESDDSGFAYYGRYYRSTDGRTPPVFGPLLAPYGSFSVLSLPADNGTWSLTLYGLSDDKATRAFRRADVYQRVIEACPLNAHWLNGEPMSDIITMSGAVDRHREFVVDGVPCATGLLTVGDAASCTNPSLGRGMTLGLMQVMVMRDCIAELFEDPSALAQAFHERSASDVGPWHDATTSIDRKRVNEMRAYVRGEKPTPDPTDQIADLTFAAATKDARCARAAGRMFSCVALPADVFSEPGFVDHVIAQADQVSVAPLPGPDRTQLLELIS